MVRGYFIIPPLFFYLLGIIFILRFSKTPLDKPANIVNVYMLMRMIKIFVSFAVILIYWMVHKENIRNFAIIFIFFLYYQPDLGDLHLPENGEVYQI